MSTTTLDVDKSELLSKATDLAVAGKGTGGPPHETVGALLNAYYRHVAPEDVVDRTEVDVYGALASHFKLAGNRPQGTARVHAFTPSLSEHGWSAGGHSVVEVVTDDMPFLVDSLTMELSRQLRGVHVVIHPHFDVVRDITGALQSVMPVEDGSLEPPDGAVRESWMHVEIDRMRDGDDDPTEIEEAVQRVLRDVRESVEDWEKMNTQVLAIVDELEKEPPPLDPDEVRQGRELLEWLAALDTHPSLAEATLDPSTGTYDIQPLVDEVEDFQVAYGVDGIDGVLPHDKGISPAKVDTSGTNKDEWVGNVANEVSSTLPLSASDPKYVAAFVDRSVPTGSTEPALAVPALRSVWVSLVVKSSDPDFVYGGPGARGIKVLDSTVKTFSTATGRPYRRRLQSFAVSLRNYQ